MSKMQFKVNCELKLNGNIHKHIFNDENMKTKKNYDETYNRQHKEVKIQKFFRNCEEQKEHDSSANERKVKNMHKEDYSKNEEERGVSRHRRISAPDSSHPTIMRKSSKPEYIEDYEETEKIPMENMNKKHEHLEYKKYAKS